jgi:hypothetical protein
MTTYAVCSQSSALQQVRLATANRANTQGQLLALVASIIDNDSSVPGATVADALNNLLLTSVYDHVVRSLADLPTPVAGNILLTTGSYAFPVPVDLGANQLRVNAGESVLLDGLGWQNVLTSSASPVQSNGGTLECRNLHCRSTAGHAISQNGGALTLLSCRGTSVAATRGAISISGTHTTELIDCELEHEDAAGYCVFVGGNTGFFKQSGGRWRSTPGTGEGMHIAGNSPQGFQLMGITTATSFDTVISYTSGTVRSGIVVGCRFTAVTGISWAAANLPTQGLAVFATAFDAATPFSGFSATSARANLKGNLGPGGLMSETPIVP